MNNEPVNNKPDANNLPGVSRLVVGRQSPALKDALWNLVRRVQRDAPMAPVTVVAPTRYSGLSLRQELGREGFFNVRFIQSPVLAELLAGAALAAQGLRPFTPILQGISLREVLRQSTGALAEVATHPRTRASVRASFQDLRQLDDGSLADLETQGGVTREVVQLYRQFRENAEGNWFDAGDLAAAAAVEVDSDRTPALSDLGHIVFYLPNSVGAAETTLMLALGRRGLCSAILGTTGDAAADAPVWALASALEPVLGNCETTDDLGVPLPVLAGEAQLHVAPNTHEELRWVIRSVMEEASSRGTPFHRMAVLYRMERPYGALIRDELRLSGIPLAGPGQYTLAESSVGRTLVGLLTLADKDFRRDEVMAWLTGCPVSPNEARLPGFNPSQWYAISREAGIVGGLDQWRTRLNAYIAKRDQEAAEGEASGELSEGRITLLKETVRVSLIMLEFMEGLAEALTPPATGSSWNTFCNWGKLLLNQYLSRDLPPLESTGKEMIDRILNELPAAESIRAGTNDEEFRQTLIDAMAVPLGHLGPTGKGLFVSSFAAAAGMSFDAIWIVGMIEGGAPPALRRDPLLPERLGQGGQGVSRIERRIAEERYDYLSAVATAPRRTLSYPVAESSSRREAHPSRWFLEQASALAGEQVHSSALPELASRDWVTISRSGAQALMVLSNSSLADTLDYQLHRLLQWSAAGQQFSKHPLVAQGALSRANEVVMSRNARHFTMFDGDLSPAAPSARFVRNMKQGAISPTRLETWASCPFRYFLGYVLRLGALDSPDDITTINALDRGNLIHKILEEFMRQTTAGNLLPPPDGTWSEQDRLRLMRLAEDAFADAESRGVTGKKLLWELVKHDIRDDLIAFLDEDSKVRSEHQTGKLQVEAGFGVGHDSPVVWDEETQLRFRGYIDRVDVSADGSSALVIDYKTGRSQFYDGLNQDPIDRGRHLQLGVYSLAAKQLVPLASRIQAAYWFATGAGNFRLAPADPFDIDDEETGKRFRVGVKTIVDGIQSGVFPANPGEPGFGGYENCLFCDFDSLCPSRRLEMWERKRQDDKVAGYLSLAGDVAAPESQESQESGKSGEEGE